MGKEMKQVMEIAKKYNLILKEETIQFNESDWIFKLYLPKMKVVRSGFLDCLGGKMLCLEQR